LFWRNAKSPSRVRDHSIYSIFEWIALLSDGGSFSGVEIQLVRVETVGSTEGFAKEATEIQNIQIADGDVVRGVGNFSQ